MSKKEVVLEGRLLKAAVRAAESPLSGGIITRNFKAQLGIDRLVAIDLRDSNPHPAALPTHVAPGASEETDDA